MVYESTKRPSCSNALKRTPDICSSSEHSSQSKKKKNKPPASRTEWLIRKHGVFLRFTAKSCGFLPLNPCQQLWVPCECERVQK